MLFNFPYSKLLIIGLSLIRACGLFCGAVSETQKMKHLRSITRKENGAEFRAWNSQVTFYWVSTLCFFSEAPWAFIVYPFSEGLSSNWGRLAWSEENHTSQPWDAGMQVVARFNTPPCPTAGRHPHVSSSICTHAPKSLPGPQAFR